jgi:hypothetical protein
MGKRQHSFFMSIEEKKRERKREKRRSVSYCSKGGAPSKERRSTQMEDIYSSNTHPIKYGNLGHIVHLLQFVQ